MAINADENGKEVDHDFLSSIEVAIVDHCDALLMQNWEHVEYLFKHLNLTPKNSHDCDFSRIRHWYLDGKAKVLRQTVIYSGFVTPEISRLFSNFSYSSFSKVKICPEYEGQLNVYIPQVCFLILMNSMTHAQSIELTYLF